MTYKQRISLFMLIDTFIIIIAFFFSHLLVSNALLKLTFPVMNSFFVILICYHVMSFHLKLYKKAWEYASAGEILSICKAVSLSILAGGSVQTLITQSLYLREIVVAWLVTIMLIGASRYCVRIFRETILNRPGSIKRTLIIGAGSAGVMVARQLKKRNDADLMPIGFIDDDSKKQKLDILGIPVLGGVDKIGEIVRLFEIDHIIIAIPSLHKKELNTIFNECAKTTAKTQILPMLEDLLIGKVSLSHFRDVRVEDLLGRQPVELNIGSISENISNKVVLVTGAGGSIGSEICRQVSKFHPKKIILLGHGENSIYSIHYELKDAYAESDIQFIPVIADIQDIKKMMAVMREYKPDVVYHAAAHKHVPLMEENPEEAIKNNIIGTWNAAEAAQMNDVTTFVMISTDKAVNPTSVMGATKRLAEMVIQHMDKESPTKFVAVRFGNVLGSRGSVIPLFKKQIENGGPVTVTHPEMVRYFMTIPEASQLVIQAGALAKGGEIFVLDMGEPVRIVDLAKNLIKLSGNSLDDIGILFTGMRRGEKLFEELLNNEEVHEKQIHPNIYIGKAASLYMQEIEEMISIYGQLDEEELRHRLIMLANKKESEAALYSMSVS
ncbi:polysaccharide biosynthesis protein [Heyndrickxia acidicola]|uniref:Nucleoside-diphosphate sugar epimerase/dehydratase n=1 Tax=Heyndrickxia acidicola TaxID=209389 RepID=A0ABU6MMJ2_9BACI|nr:nucleoside-diphosphate sugar epimerase/dehydratase [Heyndrickxia acidicola]MED1205191.1 nucleoside-diphosphate sugar epimerase/dehydratase [Heyndrickxia acidicola]